MSTITKIIQGLAPGNFVELFEVDMLSIGGDVLRFHGYPQQGPIYWKGDTYTPWSVEARGFALIGNGPPPTPTIKLGNIGQDEFGLPITGVISSLCNALQDLVGAKVIRRRTFAEFLDAANFQDGNPSADPTQELLPDIWLVEAKTFANAQYVEFELKSALDFEGQKLPARQILPGCSWLYRGAECGYVGAAMFDEQDNPTADPTLDKCGKRVGSCKLRFGEFAELPHGGFPGADSLRGY